ncbi:MAG: flagellar hook-length control protein FliK [Betaproteobacteria bacterium]|nr:flagellar hook-length control protein FliK [Betaproteobacteria bacterium]
MIPIPYLARILDVPLAPAPADRPVSGLIPVQPVPSATRRDEAAPRAAFEHLSIGQTLSGLVRSLAKGIALVEIDGRTVAMRLPRQAAPGDTLRLRFAGHFPQPVFLLETHEATPGAAPQLSQTARMLSELVQRAPERTAPTVTPSAPLLDRPVAQPAALALALRNAVVRSGLFYESHLADWVVGHDSLDGLMQEPQNRRTAADSAHATAIAADAPAAPAGEKPALAPLHALLSQQLQVLESPQFVWRGEAWPGQPLEWQLREEPGTEPDPGHAGAPHDARTKWESRLTLRLPHLGALTIHLGVDAQQAFNIRVVPEQPGVDALLQQNQRGLTERLAAAGCALRNLTVQSDAGA